MALAGNGGVVGINFAAGFLSREFDEATRERRERAIAEYAALEEKRNLSSRAATMETDLAKTQLLENAILPEGVVCPGTAVRYRDLTAGKENRITVLGPWDDFRGDDVVSYRAPLAQGLLGLEPGAQQTIELPGGTIEVEVLEIEPVHVD